MAYVSTEVMKEKRAQIKALFPVRNGWKFSVRQRHHSTICISLMQYPAGFDFPEQGDINPYWISESFDRLGLGAAEREILEAAYDVAMEGHWDKSDVMTDYFNCSWYVDLEIGQWDKPCLQQSTKKAA